MLQMKRHSKEMSHSLHRNWRVSRALAGRKGEPAWARRTKGVIGVC